MSTVGFFNKKRFVSTEKQSRIHRHSLAFVYELYFNIEQLNFLDNLFYNYLNIVDDYTSINNLVQYVIIKASKFMETG